MQINKTEQATTELGQRIQVAQAAAEAGPSAVAAVAPTKTDSLRIQRKRQQWGIMQLFSISEATQSSLVYCQRALRDFVKLHQVVAYQIDKLPAKKAVQAKQYLIDLEDEIRSIGKEQEKIVTELTEKLREFQHFILVSRSIEIPNELADGYVSHTFQRYYETCSVQFNPPPGLTLRRNVAEIAEHYSIEAILNMYNEECIDRTPQSRSLKNQTRKRGPQPLLVASSRSLLKPPTAESKPTDARVEAPSSTVAARLAPKERRAFANIGKPPIEEQQDVDAKEEFTEIQIKVEPEIIIEEQQQQPRWPLPGKAWKPGFRGRPPKIAKEGGVLHLAANDKVMKPTVKEEPHDIEEDDEEDQDQEQQQQQQQQQQQELWVATNDSSNEAPPPPTTAAYRRGRTNLLQALNKTRQANSSNAIDESSLKTTVQSGVFTGALPALNQQKGKKRSRATFAPGVKLAKHPSTGTATSSGSSPNSRCSTPSSGDSSDPRSSIGEFPAIESEPPVPTPLSIFELGQPPYLRLFGLVTHEEAKVLKESKAVRKRRSCNSTERKDFHYGRLDYYEQQLYQQATTAAAVASGAGRRRVGCSQRPVLYSPQVVVKKRKQTAPPPPPSGSGTTSGSSSSINSNSSPEATTLQNMLSELGEKCCFVCNEKGSVAELSSCTNCCNIYHIECHEGANELKEELCPVCLTD